MGENLNGETSPKRYACVRVHTNFKNNDPYFGVIVKRLMCELRRFKLRYKAANANAYKVPIVNQNRVRKLLRKRYGCVRTVPE